MSRTKCHVNKHGIAYNGNAAVNEGVHEKLPVQMRVPRVFGVDLTQMLQKITERRGGSYRNRGVTEHGFEARGGDNNFVVAALDFVRKLDENTEFVSGSKRYKKGAREGEGDVVHVRSVAVARYAPAFRLFKLISVHFDVGHGALEGTCE